MKIEVVCTSFRLLMICQIQFLKKHQADRSIKTILPVLCSLEIMAVISDYVRLSMTVSWI